MFVFSLGIFGYFNWEKLKIKPLIIWGIAILVIIGFSVTDIKAKAWSNPPNLYTIAYSLAVLFLLTQLFELLIKFDIIHNIIDIFAKIGEHSLFIYLVHFHILDIIRCNWIKELSLEHSLLKSIAIIVILILISIGIETLYNYCNRVIKKYIN